MKRASLATRVVVIGSIIGLTLAAVMAANRYRSDRALITAILHGHPGEVRAALEAGANANSRLSCLTNTTMGGLVAALVGKKDRTSPTALLVAAGWHTENSRVFQRVPEDLATVSALVDHGAAVNARDKNGDTAMLISAWVEHNAIFDYLLDHGGDMSARDNLGDDAWSLSRYNTHRLSSLLTHGQNVNERDAHGRIQLSWVAGTTTLDRIHLLLRHHANVNIRDNEGKSPLRYAKQTYVIVTDWRNNIPNRDVKRRRATEAIRLLSQAGALE